MHGEIKLKSLINNLMSIENPTSMKEVAFLEDLSGRRSFLEASDGKLYYSQPDGKLIESNEAMLASAIEKHSYTISSEEKK
jgi:hypothetical protein